jgi:hypothetical protein
MRFVAFAMSHVLSRVELRGEWFLSASVFETEAERGVYFLGLVFGLLIGTRSCSVVLG